ncbi:MAG: hypothetical protein ACP5MG_09570, partial [Verrucomicrobiia bacterium]
EFVFIKQLLAIHKNISMIISCFKYPLLLMFFESGFILVFRIIAEGNSGIFEQHIRKTKIA